MKKFVCVLFAVSFVGMSVIARAEEDERMAIVTDEVTAKECSACHMAYPPGFLPARSWEAVMGGLDKHFGEDASLPADVAAGIKSYLVANAADANGRMRGFARRLAADQTPLRITELPGFKREHDRLSDAAKVTAGSLSNCVACHRGAAQGVFEDD